MTEQELTKIKMAWARGEMVQYRYKGFWMNWAPTTALDLNCHSVWRIAPKTTIINGYEVPEPLRELKKSQKYYVTDMTRVDLAPQLFWKDHDIERTWLDRGLCHATKEAAIIHARALLSFMEQEQ